MNGVRVLRQLENTISMLYVLQDMLEAHKDSVITFGGKSIPKKMFAENVDKSVKMLEELC